jgi:hypothetical protein
MRAETTKHYATSATQVERFAGGIAWDDPNNALAINGNIGARMGDVLQLSDTKYPVGPGYPWGVRNPQSLYDYGYELVTRENWVDPPAFVSTATDNQKFPNTLRFSGFNITDAPGDNIVTNLFVHIEYRDSSPDIPDSFSDSAFPGRSHEFLPNGSRFLIVATKAGNISNKKMFDGVKSTTTNVIKKLRIPCQKDQSWATDTFAGGKVPGTYSPLRRQYQHRRNWWKTGTQTTTMPQWAWPYVTSEWVDTVSAMTPLTIAEINDSNFHIDLSYAKFENGSSGNIRIYSVSVSAEYIKPYTTSATVYVKNIVSDYPRQVSLGSQYQTAWTNPKSIGGIADATKTSNHEVPPVGETDYAWINIHAHNQPYYNTGSYDDQLIRFDSNYIFGKFLPITDIDDTADISDIILDIRVNDSAVMSGATIGDSWNCRWTYYLSDGIIPEAITQGQNLSGETIYKFSIQGGDPGIRQSYPTSRNRTTSNGYSAPAPENSDWLNWLGEYNPNDGEYYGVSSRYYDEMMADARVVTSTAWPYGNWYVKHFPLRINNIQYNQKIINTTTYPGTVYDPLWIPKALKAGKLYIALLFGIDPGSNFINYSNSPPTEWIKVDAISIRVKYGSITAPPVVSSTSDGLIYRFTP